MLSLFVTGNMFKNTAITPHQLHLFGLKLKVCPELELAFVFVFIFHFVLFLFRELDIVATVVVILQICANVCMRVNFVKKLFDSVRLIIKSS